MKANTKGFVLGVAVTLLICYLYKRNSSQG